jgi:hypothetical protein
VIGLVEFEDLDGDKTMLAITTTKQYKLTTGDEVQRITITGTPTGGDFTLTFDGQTTGAITFSTTEATTAGNIDTALEALSNIPASEVTVTSPGTDTFDVVFTGSLAAEHQPLLTIDTTGLTSGTPVGSVAYIASSWTDITGGDTWSGVVTDWLDICVAVGLDAANDLVKYIIISNGVDGPIFWDGAAATFDDWVPDIVSFASYRSMRQYYDKLVMANIQSDEDRGQHIAWSESQELLEFIDSTNNAGDLIVPGVKGSFVHLEPLGEWLVAYSDDSIAVINYVGGVAIMTIKVVHDDTRLVAGRTIVNLGAFHLFLSQENVFLFDGSRLIRTMGDRIYRQYRDELAVPRIQEAFAFHDGARQQVYFVVPVGSTDHAIYVLDYDLRNIDNSKWTRHVYHGMPRAMGTWSRTSTLTWDGFWAQNTTWENAGGAWDQGSTKSGFPVRVVGIGSGVFVADESVTEDNTTAISAYWDTIDFTAPDEFMSTNCRWLEIEAELSGSAASIYYSIDGGRNFTLADNLTLNSTWTTYKIPIDVVGQQLRVRVVNDDATGGVSPRPWIRVWYRPTGPF